MIDAHGLVTVVGAGGIGKSRLAQAVAHAQAGRWPDGAWMVELAGLSDPALLPNAVAQVLHITLTGQGDALEALVVGMARRTALLVLDNCEHMLDAVAALVQAVLQQRAERQAAGDQPGTAAPAGRAAVPGAAAGRPDRDDGRPLRASSARSRCSRPACARWIRVSR